MTYHFHYLTNEIRNLMVEELEKDLADESYYLSKNFNSVGDEKCFEIAKTEMLNGDEDTFAHSLTDNNCFDAKNKEGRTVPKNASELYAHNEFNRFYMRAIARKAITDSKDLIVYRAKESSSPRPESEDLLGKIISPVKLLEDLRNDYFIEKAFGLAKPNSGLSVTFN